MVAVFESRQGTANGYAHPMIIALVVIFGGLPIAVIGWYPLVFQNKNANKRPEECGRS